MTTRIIRKVQETGQNQKPISGMTKCFIHLCFRLSVDQYIDRRGLYSKPMCNSRRSRTDISSLSVSFHLWTRECDFSDSLLSAINRAAYSVGFSHHRRVQLEEVVRRRIVGDLGKQLFWLLDAEPWWLNAIFVTFLPRPESIKLLQLCWSGTPIGVVVTCNQVIVVFRVQHTASVVVIKLAVVGIDSVLNVSKQTVHHLHQFMHSQVDTIAKQRLQVHH